MWWCYTYFSILINTPEKAQWDETVSSLYWGFAFVLDKTIENKAHLMREEQEDKNVMTWQKDCRKLAISGEDVH